MNTYAINTTRGQEFAVADEIAALGLSCWAPKRLDSRYIKEKREAVWYDRPYVPKLIFAVIPAIYWRDVFQMKHVLGKPVPLSRRDMDGVPGHRKNYGDGAWVDPVPGLKQFREAVEAEYRDAKRLQANSDYQCQYVPGQALRILEGPFAGFRAEFAQVIKAAYRDYPQLRVNVSIFGRDTPLDIDPDRVRIA
ncbi:hypothetical protein K7H20_13840 [Salipiger manganoxidans]|uniref:transcription termination/antitermination protein NusG n=1 Tax=Salipiger marinus TaxID=555512 RepID=UPI001E34B54D|nr:hypothetical protein [Salipiger manganoxidans]MCD1619147.1 hypothetical protein [Salipiger manganoxidans]